MQARTALVYLLALLLAALAAPAAYAVTYTYYPLADARVRSDAPDVNYGYTTSLNADGSPDIDSYLKFKLERIPTGSTITQATLKIWTASSHASGFQLKQVSDNSWGELSLTYNGRPAVGSTIASTGGFASGAQLSLDVTSYVTTPGATYSFAIDTMSGASLWLDSKERDVWPAGATSPTYRQPTLEVTYTSPTQTLSSNAAADAKVDSSSPDTNYGTLPNTKMHIDGSPDVDSYVRFDVAGIPAGTYVSSAFLKVYATSTLTAPGNKSIIVKSVPNNSWAEDTLTWNNRPGLGAELGRSSDVTTANQYYSINVTSFVSGNGTYSFALDQDPGQMQALAMATKEYSPANPPLLEVTYTFEPVVVAAGDISCKQTSARVASLSGGCHQQDTAFLTLNERPDLVLALGDVQYECGADIGFTQRFDATWGLFKSLIRPAVGNHEYQTIQTNPGTVCETTQDETLGYVRADHYFDYFNGPMDENCTPDPCPAGSRGTVVNNAYTGAYYSYDLGPYWHVIAVNSQDCKLAGVGCGPGSAIDIWLRNDIASTTEPCIIAYDHHQRWSSGSLGSDTDIDPLWRALVDNADPAKHVDVFLVGHDHHYERFAKQDADGNASTTGTREFVVGTGGKNLTAIGTPIANSEARSSATFGVLKLTLHSNSYDYHFVSDTSRGTINDSDAGVPCN